jgi:pimeloyl-ACP methyl ester carboxylesterase
VTRVGVGFNFRGYLGSVAQRKFGVQTVVVHGHRRAYVKAGEGPALLLLHGLGCDHHTWDPVISRLARHFTVIAPDLLGHGSSDKPRGDYSVAGYANGMRDLLTVLDVDRVTVVGHSLGGGIAMQFAYQFPERTERLCLLAPGGLGPEVSPLLKSVTLPGAALVMSALAAWPVRRLGHVALQALAGSGHPRFRDAGELAAIYTRLEDPATRKALRHVTRNVIDWQGQIVTMTDRAYLTQLMPLLVVWGADDAIIPAHHADLARRYAPTARVEVLTDSGHFPHRDHPAAFVRILRDFVAETKPATHNRRRWGAMLRRGPAAPKLEVVETA